MPPRAVPPILLLLSFLASSCAFATGANDPDGGRSDARTRADADPDGDASNVPVVDAAPGDDIDASLATPDAAASLDAAPLTEALLITEIVDADLAGGLPKFVEITNLGGAPVNLAQFSLGVFSNGSFTINSGASTVLAGTLAPSASFVISFENSDSAGNSSFRTVYGTDADDLSFGAVINGNDTIVLFRGAATGNGSDATIVDLYGVIGTDGIGEAWEYTDGFATRRQASTTPSAVFVPSDWGFSGAAALESVDAAGIAAATSPGSH